MRDDTQRGDGAMQRSLPNLLQRTYEVQDDQILYRFGNGLLIKTEILRKPDRLRILPLGTPQGSLMNYMLHCPDVVHGKDVFGRSLALARLVVWRCNWGPVMWTFWTSIPVP